MGDFVCFCGWGDGWKCRFCVVAWAWKGGGRHTISANAEDDDCEDGLDDSQGEHGDADSHCERWWAQKGLLLWFWRAETRRQSQCRKSMRRWVESGKAKGE